MCNRITVARAVLESTSPLACTIGTNFVAACMDARIAYLDQLSGHTAPELERHFFDNFMVELGDALLRERGMPGIKP